MRSIKTRPLSHGSELPPVNRDRLKASEAYLVMRARAEAAEARLALAVELLGVLEWQNDDCIICYAGIGKHLPDCALAALIGGKI